MSKSGLAAAVLAVSVIGCGGSGPKLVPVHGEVTLNGKPLEGAVVTFLPDAATPGGHPGEDVTGPMGNYKAMTNGRSGLAPGKYKVTITKTTIEASKIPEAFKDDPFMAQLSLEGPPDPKRKAKSSAVEKIEQVFDREVPPEGGQIDFDVKAGPAAKDT